MTSTTTAGLSAIKNVVVVFQENHTFDNYFGTYPGADGTAGKSLCLAQTPGSTSCVAPFHDSSLTPVDMNHGWNTAHKDYDGEKWTASSTPKETGRRWVTTTRETYLTTGRQPSNMFYVTDTSHP
jgi:phospholipase C